MKDILVYGQYRVDFKVGQGAFGFVYAGTDLKTKQTVAMKLSHMSDGRYAPKFEAEVYAALSGGTGVPRVLWFGDEYEYYVLVHELLGPFLEDLFNYCDRKFSLKTLLLIADQAIRRLQYIHDKGYLHCDIKPEHLLLGTGRNGNVLYVIDFGLSTELNEETGLGTGHMCPFGGLLNMLASTMVASTAEPSRGNDLQSLGYVLIYLAQGALPWEDINAPTERERYELIKQKKMSTDVGTLCKGLPEEFASLITYARSLEPTDRPNYTGLLKSFDRVFAGNGFKHDNVFDWTEKRFHELRGTTSSSELT